MQLILFIALQLCVVSAHAQPPVAAQDDFGYEAPPELDLDQEWLEPADLVKILSYDRAAHAYEITKLEDPTVERIFASPEALAISVGGVNIEMLQQNPNIIVGREYELDHELVLLESDDITKRKAARATPPKGAAQIAATTSK